MDYVTIDFEASCLPRHGRSYPIELGISGRHGTSSWLIRPPALWRDWDWAEEAQALHGITREALDDTGVAPEIVLEQALKTIGNARPIADSCLDALWWDTLCRAARAPLAGHWPLVRIEQVGGFFDEIGARHEHIMAAQQRAETLCPQRHRAGADARWLWILLSSLTARQAIDAEEPFWSEDLPLPVRPPIAQPALA